MLELYLAALMSAVLSFLSRIRAFITALFTKIGWGGEWSQWLTRRTFLTALSTAAGTRITSCLTILGDIRVKLAFYWLLSREWWISWRHHLKNEDIFEYNRLYSIIT